MSKYKIREQTNCLNCGNTEVLGKFCQDCGQENIETRQTFGGLAFHFIEDVTHYDTAFWKTMRNLLFNPARLTLEYLSGKRKQFVPPVKLYIFVSFITFFLIAVLPPLEQEDGVPLVQKQTVEIKSDDSDEADITVSMFGSRSFSSLAELDSVQKALPKEKRLGKFTYNVLKYKLERRKKVDGKVSKEAFDEIFFHNLPSAIFIYLPVFGFTIYLFHNKRRWFFFDHAIFTIHYFAFILLMLTLDITIVERIISYIPNEAVVNFLSFFFGFLTVPWIIIYFYVAHYRMYRETKIISFVKASALLFINMVLFTILMIGLAVITWLQI